jgi:hypothetical protein
MKYTLIFFALLFQQGDPHEGQPATCNNYFKTPKEHRCNCHRATKCARERQGLGEDPKCQVYCRKDACKCLDPCTS